MKKMILFATVACMCCGPSSLFAQELQGIPSLAPQLVAAQTEFDETGVPLVPSQAEIADPFQMLNGSTPQPQLPTGTNTAQPLQPQHHAEIAEPADPTSLPVSRYGEPRDAVVDAMANHGTIASIPHASLEPVDWCVGQMRAPNHVADILMRQECVDGLWARYPAQRAAECAYMWSKLTATKKCKDCCNSCNSGCGACGNGNGCCNSSCGGCKSGNRYQCDGGCDASCAHCAANANAQTMQQAVQMARVDVPAVR